MTLVDDVRQALRAASAASSSMTYPDTDNQMEDGVFSFAKRDDEANAWRALVAQVQQRGPPGPALDVGCGLGAFVAPLRAAFADAFFVDRDAARLAAAARSVDVGADHFFVVDPLAVDPLGAAQGGLRGAFAFVQAIQVVGHLAHDDGARFVQILASWLAPGGALLLALPFTGTPFDLHVITRYVDGMAKPTPQRVSPARFDVEARAPQPTRLPVRHFAMGSVHALADGAGLVVATAQPYHWFDETTGDLFALLVRR